MQRVFTVFVVIAAALFIGPAATAAPATRTDELRSRLEALATAGEFSGVIEYVEQDGFAFRFAAGSANLELGVPLRPELRFKLHSSSKLVTAVAVLKAAETTSLSVDDRICSYLEPCPGAWRNVRIHQLLNHTAGIPDHSDKLIAAWSGSLQDTYARVAGNLIAENADGSFLQFAPGEGWRYSNFGPTLASLILERHYGMPLHEVYRTLVFDPLEMTGSSLEQSFVASDYAGPLVERGLVNGYNGTPAHPVTAFSKTYVTPGAGGVVSRTADLTRFLHAVFLGDFLAEESRRMIREYSRELPDKNMRAGLGTFFNDNRFWHSGGDNGYVSSMAVYPERGGTVVILSNLGFVDVGRIRGMVEESLVAAGSDSAANQERALNKSPDFMNARVVL